MTAVFADQRVDDERFDWIAVDNRKGAMLAMNYLLRLGHRRIGCIQGPESYSDSRERMEGVEEACSQRGVTLDKRLIYNGDFNFESGVAGGTELIEKGATAIFAFNDMMAENILRVEHLKKYFPIRRGLLTKEQKVLKAVNDVSLTIHQGEIFGVVGESGCGKSTLARCIMSLTEVTDGQIYFQEKKITNLNNKELKPFRQNMQMVFQNPFSSFNPTMSIRQTFYEIGKVYGLNAADIKARCKELVGQVRLSEEVLTRRPEELSGGQLQRLAIARAMYNEPNRRSQMRVRRSGFF